MGEKLMRHELRDVAEGCGEEIGVDEGTVAGKGADGSARRERVVDFPSVKFAQALAAPGIPGSEGQVPQ